MRTGGALFCTEASHRVCRGHSGRSSTTAFFSPCGTVTSHAPGARSVQGSTVPPKTARTRVPGHSAASTSASRAQSRVESSSVQAVQFFVKDARSSHTSKPQFTVPGWKYAHAHRYTGHDSPPNWWNQPPRPVAMLIISKVS